MSSHYEVDRYHHESNAIFLLNGETMPWEGSTDRAARLEYRMGAAAGHVHVMAGGLPPAVPLVQMLHDGP